MSTTDEHIHERWCASCGIRLPDGVIVCPHCGAEQDDVSYQDLEQPHTPPVDIDVVEHDVFDADATHTMTRIESAVPAGPDAYSDMEEDTAPRTKITLLTALAAVVFVGGIVLLITHPWDPDVFSTRAKEPADTSMAGYPGEVTSLTGQDHSPEVDSVTADESTYQLLLEAHEHLLDLEWRLSESESLLRSGGITGTSEEREQGRAAQTELAVELSNVIASLDVIDITTGTYAEDVENLRTLGNWLRNWSDALTSGWSISAGLDSAAEHESEVLSPLFAASNSDGKNAYQALFDQYVDAWIPEPPQS